MTAVRLRWSECPWPHPSLGWSVAAARRRPQFEDLPHVTLVGLRHTHATILLELGVATKIVAERLGHSTIATTLNTYSHVTPTMQADALERFSKALADRSSHQLAHRAEFDAIDRL